MVMELTDPKYVYLVLDTGHATLGGIDPVKALRDYYSARRSVHLKDAEAKYSTAKRMARPCAERGASTSRSICTSGSAAAASISSPSSQELRRRNYDGWVTMDFDMPRPGEGTVEDDMNRHKKYLTETLKGQLRS